MKHTQRLDNGRLAEVLHERGMADLEAIRELLDQSRDGGTAFAEALVTANLVGDWELSRVVCEIFNLPFLPVEMAKPDKEAAENLDRGFLAEYALVPLWRFGQVLTVCMPGLVPADVLGVLAADSDLVLLPVVGTVESNRRWVEENFEEAAATVKKKKDSSWTSIFDDADAAVLMEIDSTDEVSSRGDEVQEALEEVLSDDLEKTLAEDLEKELAEASELEFTSVDEEEASVDSDVDSVDGLTPPAAPTAIGDDEEIPKASGGLDLPPMPEF